MTTQQGLRQQSIRDATGTAHDYNGDWHALFDLGSIATGPFDQRLIIWINARIGTNHTELNGAMAAFAADEGAGSFSAIGTFTAASGGSPGHPVGLFPYLWTKNATSVSVGSEEELLIYVY